MLFFFFFSSRRRHTRCSRDWSSDVCSSDLFSVAMIIDKHRRFSSTTRESEKFKPEFKKFLHGGDVQNLLEAARQHQNSHVAQVVSAGLIEDDGGAQRGGEASASFDLVTSASRGPTPETLINFKK